MDDLVEVSRLLDILGNRNRRRIIELLRQKPCIVTEISDTLVLSPKVVIDHLLFMERESILSCEIDERRRKYYYLENDILIDLCLKQLRVPGEVAGHEDKENEWLKNSIGMLGHMIRAHDQIFTNLEQISHDIETRMADIVRNHTDIFSSERKFTIIITLSHKALTLEELHEVSHLPHDELLPLPKQFEHAGIVKITKNQFTLRGVHAE
ncbi:MAG: ArsR family transcriptional regulator [Methanomicrobiales archaeon]